MMKRLLGFLMVLIGAFLAMGACMTVLVATTDDKPRQQGDPDSPSVMSGNGTFKLGGVEGKNWGVYEARATGNCQWSIRSVARYREGWILDSGTAATGEKVTVDIQPDGDVNSFTGQINDDHRLVFMTNGCGIWRAD
ncbi:Uncharacterised protein [Mycobacteroides abscessus subsp. abscessus]|nr:Uncharacterised protein [Mycobacteroides abscessus subsp. abscessus]SHS96090.1 Uncharacterised protein [Mycobacteroides abscessus subsp. abscessus]SHT26564.1 Uncharacterised protein [Mycobacteroides abscessus subsp. abscessus]SKF08878.1 Uncharacterised protein [Mycobacteroides abscessus subsp. abscessus]SKG75675.1 Uncharacterised protein [Mycobacteroides abscessus subsp. abscessus]